MISSLGDSGLSVFQAGHWDWQRPHSVQVAKSSRPFQVKSSILPLPKAVSSSRFSRSSKSTACRRAGDRQQRTERVGQPLGGTLSGASAMCRCLE